jgi:hypothetical protein
MNGEEGSTAAERRLDEHLELLREEPPRPGRELAPVAVVRRARWQRALGEPLRAAGRLLFVAVEGLAALVGLRRRADGR